MSILELSCLTLTDKWNGQPVRMRRRNLFPLEEHYTFSSCTAPSKPATPDPTGTNVEDILGIVEWKSFNLELSTSSGDCRLSLIVTHVVNFSVLLFLMTGSNTVLPNANRVGFRDGVHANHFPNLPRQLEEWEWYI